METATGSLAIGVNLIVEDLLVSHVGAHRANNCSRGQNCSQDKDEDTGRPSHSDKRGILKQVHYIPPKDGTMTRLQDISAHNCESHARTSSRPSIVYVHSEAFRACRLQMRFMLTLATLVKDEIDLFVLDALTAKESLAPLGITHAPALIFRKEPVRHIIEGITPVETLLAVIKSHLGIDIGRREHRNERQLIPW